MTIKSERAVVETLHRNGWSYIKRQLRCESCTAKHRARNETKQEAEAMTADTAPASQKEFSWKEVKVPDREMRRMIRSMLDDVYDTCHGRYLGKESDETVASAIGQGCMWGWVAQERVDGYGDGGGNEDTDRAEVGIEAAIAEIKDKSADLEALRQELIAAMSEMTKRVSDAIGLNDTYAASLDKMKKDVAALKPRAGRR